MKIAKWWASLDVNEKLDLAKKHNIRFLAESTISKIWEAEGRPVNTFAPDE